MYILYKKNLNKILIISIVLAVIISIFFPSFFIKGKILGEVFLRFLSLLIIPVVVTSIFCGITNLKSSNSIGRIGFKTILYYLTTTGLATITGLILVLLTMPGKDVDIQLSGIERNTSATSDISLISLFYKILPTNIFSALAEGNILGIITFTILFSILLINLNHSKKETLLDIADIFFQLCLNAVNLIMLYAPIGIFFLIGNLTAKINTSNIAEEFSLSLLNFSLTVLLGLFIHGFITLPLILSIFKVNPFKFFKNMSLAFTTAFCTASSAATLPVTIECLEKKAKVSNKVASFVAPLGATVNMDGTAIYEAIAAVFIANLYGIDLSFYQVILVFITATFSAIGAAGVPGAGIVMMGMILSTIGIPLEGIQIIIVVDRILDSFRTAINVWGDSIGAMIINKTEKDFIS